MYFIVQNGQKLGPYNDSELVRFIRDSRFHAGDLAWKDGMSEWLPLQQVFSQQFPAPPVMHPAQPAAGYADNSPPALQQSGFGITSFILSILSGILMFVAIVAAGVLEESTPGGIDEESAEAVTLGLFIWGFMGLSALACLFGIIGLYQRDRKKTYAMIGTILSAVTVVGVILLMLLGLAIG